ncbi:MAG: cation diffusion facilitator family transporter [Rhodospirillales bacterium]|nr:cation diffusion facilitator family transporter [Rhodospirillales bacterium]
MRLATYASVAVALVLIVVKLAAYIITGSISMLSSLIDSLLDAAASIVNLLAVRAALVPADEDHRFGHGKAEPLAGLAQAAFIGGSAAFLLIEAGQRLIQPRPVVDTDVGIAVTIFAVILTGALVLFQRSVVRRTGSVAIGADSIHYSADLLLNGSVILSLVLSGRFGMPLADPLFAVAIAAWIVWGAAQIARQSLHLLMDRELPDSDRDRIRAIATGHPGVRGIHDMRTRSSGTSLFIQLDLELDGELPLKAAHEIAETVMADIVRAYPSAEVFVHQDPAGVEMRHSRVRI